MGFPGIGVPAETGAFVMLGLQLQPVQFMDCGYQYRELIHGLISERDFPRCKDTFAGAWHRGVETSAAVR